MKRVSIADEGDGFRGLSPSFHFLLLSVLSQMGHLELLEVCLRVTHSLVSFLFRWLISLVDCG